MKPLGEAFRGDRWMKTACVLWALLYVLFVIRVVVTPQHIGVYPIFAGAVQHWWSGLPMYESYPGVDLYRYSPTFAVGFSAFGLLHDSLGSSLWNLLSIVALFHALRVLVARVFPWTWTTRQEGIFLTLTLLGCVRGVWSAQSNALLFALAVLGVAALLDRRWWSAAFLLAVPVYIKIWPIALVILLCVRWARPLIPRFLVAVLALGALPFLTRPWSRVVSGYRGFWEMLVDTGPIRWSGVRDAWTIWEQFGAPDPDVLFWLRAGSALLVFAWCVWQATRLPSSRHLATAILAVWATWQMLVGPGTERLTYGLIAPFNSAAIVLGLQYGLLRTSSVASWSMTTILGAGFMERTLLPYLQAAPAIQPAGVVVYAFWLARWDWRNPPLGGRPRAESMSRRDGG